MTMNIHFPATQSSVPGVLERAEDSRRGVVLIHEWWGINENMRSACEKLARAGYTTLVPDLYHGFSTKDPAVAGQKMKSLDMSRAVDEIRAAARYLWTTEKAQSVAVMGFCMGGALTLLSALKNEGEFDGAICFYGIPDSAAGDLSQIKIPVQGHFATQDDWCTAEAVGKLEEALQKSGVRFELHRYEAKHAFANEKRPEVYHQASAELAWRRTLHFLNTTLRVQD